MFYLLLGIALLLFTLLQKKADRLSTAKPANSLKVTGIVAVATIVSFVYAHLHQPETTGEVLETFGAKEGDIMVKIPKRLFDPKRWFEPVTDKDLSKLKEAESLPFGEIYDRKLIIYKSGQTILFFSMNSQDSLEALLDKCRYKAPNALPRPKDAFTLGEFKEAFDLNYRPFGDLLMPEKLGYLPHAYLPWRFERFSIRVDLLKEALPDLVGFSSCSFWKYRAGITQKEIYIDAPRHNASNLFFCIPYHSNEALIDLSLEKCLSLLFPYIRSRKYQNLSGQINEDRTIAQHWANWSYAPVFANQFTIFLLILFFTIILLSIKSANPGLVICALLLAVGWHKYYDQSHADHLGYLEQNRYALPEARQQIKENLQTQPPFSVGYDILKSRLAISEMPRYTTQIQTTNEIWKSAFDKVTFSDRHQLVNLHMITNQVQVREESEDGSRGGFNLFEDIKSLIIQKILKIRADGSTARDFLFDPRFFAVRPVKSAQYPDETEDAWLRREFTTFYTDLFQTETAALETAQ